MLLLLLLLALGELGSSSESYGEHLRLRRLRGRTEQAALATFAFEAAFNATGPEAAQHTELFPVGMVQVLQAHRLSELRLSMSSGFWDAEAWGGAARVPPGLALSVATPGEGASAEASWDGASAAVAGLFCPALASLRYEDTASPMFFGSGRRAGHTVLRAAKPQEMMCRDHLRAFTRLLPCGAGSNLASSLAHVLTLANSRFLSVELLLRADSIASVAGGRSDLSYSMSLVVSAVLRKASGTAGALVRPGSNVEDLSGFLSAPEAQAELPSCCMCQLPGAGPSQLTLQRGDAAAAQVGFQLLPAAPSVAADHADADADTIEHAGRGAPSGFGEALHAFWAVPAASVPLLLSPSSVAVAKGGMEEAPNTAPGLGVSLGGGANSYRSLQLQHTVSNPSPTSPLLVVLWQTLPWHLELKLSTLRADLHVNGQGLLIPTIGWQSTSTPVIGEVDGRAGHREAMMAGSSGLLKAWVQLSRRRGRGGVTGDDDANAEARRSPSSIELVLLLPPNAIATVSMDADRAFMYFTDYPPDAARGIDVPAPVAAFYSDTASLLCPGQSCQRPALDEWLAAGEPDGTVYAASGALLPVSWPDFSMPYNVICISCTLPMMIFGAVASGVVSVPIVGGPKPRPVNAFILRFLWVCDALFGG